MLDEQQHAVNSLEADNKVMLKVFESNDRILTSLVEIKNLTELNRVLNEWINELRLKRKKVLRPPRTGKIGS